MLLAVTILALASTALAGYHHDYSYPSEEDSYSHHDHEQKYHGPPAPLKHDGTVDYTPEVKHARAAHFAALQAYRSSFPGHGHHYESESSHIPYAHFYNPNPAPVKHDGSVDDLPEVKAARNHHLALYAKELYSRHKRSYSLGAPLKHDGTVDETPEVKNAKAVHFAALAQARSYTPYHSHGPSYSHSPSYSHGGYKKYYEPAPLNHDGTVGDTDDVKHAKAILYKAHSEAKARLHSAPHYAEHAHHYPAHHEHSDHSYSNKYHGPPAPLNHDGTVAETPEVKHAKAVHFSLYSQALHRHRRDLHFQPAPLNSDGTVAETPEVQKAKAVFFAAHAAEAAQADHSWVEPEYNDEPRFTNYVEPIQYHSKHSAYPSKHNFEQPKHSVPHFNPPQHYSNHFEPAPLNHDGTVADTPAIKAAKSIHFAAYQQAKVAYPHSYPVHHTPSHSEPSHSAAPSHYSHYKKPVIPAPLNHDGTVAETPEIQAAKAIHFAAHQEAFARAVPSKYSHPHY